MKRLLYHKVFALQHLVLILVLKQLVDLDTQLELLNPMYFVRIGTYQKHLMMDL